MSRKQELYLMLLRHGLVFIRNYQSQNSFRPWWRIKLWQAKRVDKACYEVAQFLHNLPPLVPEPDFTPSDLEFLNDTRLFFERDTSKHERVSQSFLPIVRQIFQIVPEEMCGELKWAGPELNMTPAWQRKMNEHLFRVVTENSNIESLHIALAQGADIAARDSNGKTALTHAIALGKNQHVQVLKDAGAQE